MSAVAGLGGGLDRLTVADVLLILGVAAGAVAAVRRLWPWVRRFVAFVNALVGESAADVLPGQHRRPGVLDRLASVEEAVVVIAGHAERAADAAVAAQAAAEDAARQLHPNGGSSARDRLDQIAGAVGAGAPERRVTAGNAPTDDEV